MERQRVLLSRLLFACGLAISTMLVSCDTFGVREDEKKVDYLAVQIDENDSWSIIDAEGKVIVDREYDKDDKVSSIYDGGIYWVYSKNKYRLYSIESPKKAISDKEYDKVTGFREGKAFVSVNGQPIIMIDEKGNHIKTLSKNIASVYEFRDGMAPYQDQAGKFGYINKSGEIQIAASYKDIHHFGSGVTCVYSGEDGKNVTLIDKKGNTIKTWNKDKYTPCDAASEDKLAVKVDMDSDIPSVTYLDLKGNELFGKIKDYKWAERFLGGYAVIGNFANDDYAVINDKGEKVIRGGKYKYVCNMGNGTFCVKKGDKYGVVDAEDNTLVRFDYEDNYYYRLGDNYIMKSGNYYVIVTPKGEEIKKTEFRNYSHGIPSGAAEYIDFQTVADLFTQDVSTKGVVCCNGHDDLPSIAKNIGLKLDSCESYHDIIYTNITKGKWTVKRGLQFTNHMKTEKFHEEKVNDGWFESTRYVSDGYQWNPDSKLKYMTVSMELPAEYHKSFISQLENSIKSKGFKKNKDKDYYYCGSGNNEKRIKISSTEYNNQIVMTFVTNSEYLFYI